MKTENPISPDIPVIPFAVGQKYFAKVPFCGYNDGNRGKIHIVSVINEGYGDKIVYRCFGRHKRWWHYFIEDKELLEMYIYKAKKK